MNPTRAILFLLTLVGLASCARRHDPVAPVPGNDLSGQTALVAKASVSSPSVRPGETVEIVVTLTNTSREPVTRRFTSGCWLAYQVRDGQGRVVAPLGFVCTAEAPTVTWAPGESKVGRFTWDGRGYDLTTGARPDVPPGAYSVHGGLDAFHFGNASEAVPIEVLPHGDPGR